MREFIKASRNEGGRILQGVPLGIIAMQIDEKSLNGKIERYSFAHRVKE
jgi:hypothetical protein